MEFVVSGEMSCSSGWVDLGESNWPCTLAKERIVLFSFHWQMIFTTYEGKYTLKDLPLDRSAIFALCCFLGRLLDFTINYTVITCKRCHLQPFSMKDAVNDHVSLFWHNSNTKHQAEPCFGVCFSCKMRFLASTEDHFLSMDDWSSWNQICLGLSRIQIWNFEIRAWKFILAWKIGHMETHFYLS